MMSNKVQWGYFLNLWNKYQKKVPVLLDPSTHPHALISGKSGSGKSTAILFLIGKLMQMNEDIVVYILDFKNSDDFHFLDGYKYFFRGNNCIDGLRVYYQSFIETREKGISNKRHILIFDEYPSCINYFSMQDKLNKTKFSNEVQGIVSELLMLGRGLNYGIWTIVQRPDSSLFNSGSRDNFMVNLALGTLSKEHRTMIFAGEDIDNNKIYGKGEGVLLADGHPLFYVKFPLIQNVEAWKSNILKKLINKIGEP